MCFFFLFICIFGSIFCFFSPRHPRNVFVFSCLFASLSKIFGLRIETRFSDGIKNLGNAVFIANHQNNYDIIIIANILQPYTVIVGKRNLLWIPFFGLLYWISGNILIQRNKRFKAHSVIHQIVGLFNKKRISFFIFPEGTRSRGRGLLSFKTGAFHIAKLAKVPIVPVVVSNTHGKINLNRLNNGLVIVELLSPLSIRKINFFSVYDLTKYCHELMKIRLQEINSEIENRKGIK